MRSRRPSPEHEEAVARRLASLVAELEAARPERTGAGAGSQLDRAPDPEPFAPEEFDEPDECEVTVVRLPGRHAARRGEPVVVDELDGLPGWWRRVVRVGSRLALAPAHLAVVAALVAGGLAVTCWWLVASGSEPRPVAAPVPVSEQDPSAGQGQGSEPAASSTGEDQPSAAAGAVPGTAEVVVDVAGKVKRPGIAVLPAGSRVVDALEAAGGARRGVDLSELNLARLLVDGEQILVGVEPPPGVANSAVPGPDPSPGGGLVNINQAGQTELETLPGVGPVTAAAIVAWRTEHGGFRSVDDLLDVSGIGEATLAKLAPLVTL